MYQWLIGRSQTRAKAGNLYGAVVTLARSPSFYSRFGIPDTAEGRFEMVTLALFLVLERAKAAAGSEKLVQQTIEAFVTDMDDCLREMGVGDLPCPKRSNERLRASTTGRRSIAQRWRRATLASLRVCCSRMRIRGPHPNPASPRLSQPASCVSTLRLRQRRMRPY